MSRLPKKIAQKLLEEAREWDTTVDKEHPHKVEQLLGKADFFKASRPPRRPVSLRLDPLYLSLTKRLARKKGIPHTQLMALWLHERIEKEKPHIQ